MLNYHYVPEDLNRRVLRVLNTMLFAYIAPLWMQLAYMGEAVGESAERIVVWNQSLHPVTGMLLVQNLMMTVYVLVVEIVQERVRNFWVYLGTHAACMAVIWILFRGSEGGIPRLIICVLLLLCALYARIHETHIGYPAIGWLAVGIVMVLVGAHTDLHDMRMMGYVTEIVSVVLFALHYNELSIEHALQHTHSTGKVPYDKMHQTNLIVMGIWLVAATGLILFMTFSGIGDSLFDVIEQGMIWILRQLVRLLTFLLSLLPDSGSYQRTVEKAHQLQMGEVDAVSSIWMIILMAIWETLMALYQLIGFAAAIWILVQCGKWLYQAFIAASPEERQRMTWQHVTEHSTVITGRHARRLSPFDPTPAARIRWSYIRMIRKGTGFQNVRVSMTPEELMTVSVKDGESMRNTLDREEAGHIMTDRLEQIRLLYETARYMPTQCTFHDASQMQRLIREVEQELRQESRE